MSADLSTSRRAKKSQQSADNAAICRQIPSEPAGYWQVLVSGAQVEPDAQSVGTAQGAVLHPLAVHAYGAHGIAAPAVHVPWPSHVEAAVTVDDVTSHAATRQTVPMSCIAHAPAPSQVPVVPHVAAAMGRQVASGSAPPAATGWQAPVLFAHDVHAAQLSSPQQVCSTQWPLMQVEPSPPVQAPPLGVRFVQEPLAHVSPGTQSPSPPQAVRQAAPAPQT
jgi:hypothetical protein